MIELIETQSKNALNRALNNLPVHNKPTIKAFQNDEDEIVIDAMFGSEIKTYSLKASKYDVFEWYWGVRSTNGVNVDEVLNSNIYKQYAEHFKNDWEEVKQ